jgi:hypothetical protein
MTFAGDGLRAVARNSRKWNVLRQWRRARDLNSEEGEQLNGRAAIGPAHQRQLEYD